MMAPLEESYGDNRMVTRSPGMIRGKFNRTWGPRCASTLNPVANSTRYIRFGSTSITAPRTTSPWSETDIQSSALVANHYCIRFEANLLLCSVLTNRGRKITPHVVNGLVAVDSHERTSIAVIIDQRCGVFEIDLEPPQCRLALVVVTLIKRSATSITHTGRSGLVEQLVVTTTAV